MTASDDARRLHGEAIARLKAGAAAEGIALLRQALRLTPLSPPLLHDLGLALSRSGQPNEALATYERALLLAETGPDTHFNRANLLLKLGRLEEAEAAFHTGQGRFPGDPRFAYNLAVLYRRGGRTEEAIRQLRLALRAAPRLALAWLALADACRVSGRIEEAIDALRHARANGLTDISLLSTEADLLLSLGRQEQAEALAVEGLASEDAAPLHRIRALARVAMGRQAEALDLLRDALGRHPDDAALLEEALVIAWRLCRWEDSDAWEERLALLVRAGATVAPFTLAALPGLTPLDLRAAASRVAERAAEGTTPMPPATVRQSGLPRVGFLSDGFRDFPTARLAVDVLERLDRSRIEPVAFSQGPDDGSDLARRLRAAFPIFRDIRGLSDRAAADRVRDLGVDLLVDLKGHAGGGRLSVLAYRPAPVQALWLGYPGTSGAPFVDWIIADPVVAPDNEAQAFSERVVHLPCYQPNARRPGVDAPATRAEHGLPERALVLASFNYPWKIGPGSFSCWMAALLEVPDAVLWLLDPGGAAIATLRQWAAAAGVAPERLIPAPSLGLDRHMARLKLADLFVDTWPYGAHTTAGDALAAGVPLLTLRGPTFPGRVAASLLLHLGIEDLVAGGVKDYRDRLLELCRDRVRLAALRAAIPAARDAAMSYDAGRFADALVDILVGLAARPQPEAANTSSA